MYKRQPYKGAAPALTDVVSGVVSMGFMTALSAVPHMQSGRLKPIAVAAERRLPQIPAVPTMAELGLKDFEVSSWSGLFAPARTPPEIVAKLQREVARILALPDIRDKFAAQGAEPVGSSPEQFRGYVRSEIDKWAQVVRAVRFFWRAPQWGHIWRPAYIAAPQRLHDMDYPLGKDPVRPEGRARLCPRGCCSIRWSIAMTAQCKPGWDVDRSSAFLDCWGYSGSRSQRR